MSMNSSKWVKLISLCPQMEVKFEEGKIQVVESPLWRSNNKWECFPLAWETYSLTGGDTTHFRCRNCNGETHREYNKAPVEIKHVLHQKHSLQLVLLHLLSERRRCSCCDEYLKKVFYYCSICDFAMNLACAEKPPVLLSIYRPRWHDHTLALFPRKNSLTCNVCGLIQSSGLYYMCPPCDFVMDQSCLSLPCVIRISRHPHRLSFSPYFRQGDWSCGVCRTKINNKYGGYSCIKDGCSYAAHSKCATQSNVWDGEELEGLPEDGDEEEIEPFVRIKDGVIHHFLHQHHHLRLEGNTDRDYDENMQCQACITPIYFGNFYSCLHCDFILHEKCANLSRKIYHPIHPHQLTMVGGYEGILDFEKDICSACIWLCKAGFFYECGKEGCDFKLHPVCHNFGATSPRKSYASFIPNI
ncbi:unnamed protein product [Eruca vesicaria subsp. sativa]|uniref:DC1 domain-containing protein n=1 Tax=Eruca vesicaria subsp. sativa TaxID=29727 RepID=A0ABC8LR52_ERUVS|nr:unnamed protein product [Eruca vesicaria subsp. sativa]